MQLSFQSKDINYYEKTIYKEQILNYQKELWCILLGFNVSVGEKFCNPLRIGKVDRHPNVVLNYNSDGILLMWDNADTNFKGVSVFEIGKNRYNCSYKEFLQKAYYELLKNYNIPSNSFFQKEVQIPKKKFFTIKTKSRIWNNFFDKDLWFVGGITKKLLKLEGLFPISTYWSKDPKSSMGILNMYKCIRPTYCLKIGDKVKIIQPAWKGEKSSFLTNIQYEIGGNSEFKDFDLLLITKSIKDYLILLLLGYNVRYVPSETYPLTKELIELCSKFKRVIFLYDNDETGIRELEVIKRKTTKVKALDNVSISTYHLPVKLLKRGISDPFEFAQKRTMKQLKLQLKLDNIY